MLRCLRRGLIGIGRGLTASPLPHHRTFGSRIRRFGGGGEGEPYPPPAHRFPACQRRVHPRCRARSPNTSPEALSPLHVRPLPRSPVRAFGPPALRLRLSVAPPFGLGVPHERRLRRACRVGGGRAVWPCL